MIPFFTASLPSLRPTLSIRLSAILCCLPARISHSLRRKAQRKPCSGREGADFDGANARLPRAAAEKCEKSWLASPLLAQMPAPQTPEPIPLPHPELPPVPAPPATLAPWIFWTSGILGILLICLILWMLLRPKPLRPAPPTFPRREAAKALQALRTRAEFMPPADVAHEVSMILRRYLEQRLHIPATARTTPELFHGQAPPPPTLQTTGHLQVRPIPNLPKVTAPFASLAEWWDQLAFAPTPASSSDAIQLVNTAIQRLEEDPA